MAKKIKTLSTTIEQRLTRIGISTRKAQAWAPVLAKAFRHTQKRMATGMAGVTGQAVTSTLVGRLSKYGLKERQALMIATKLAPTVRTALKASVIVSTAIAIREDLAPLVNGTLRLRLDLPVAPWNGAKGIEILRVMHGLTSTASYLVVAVKGDDGICAVRKFSNTSYKIKYFPTFAYWDTTRETLLDMGGSQYLNRGPYERVRVSDTVLATILQGLTARARMKAKATAIARRFFAIGIGPLVKAFGFLQSRDRTAA